MLDGDGRILLFNDACERATGFSRDEVLGREARDFVIPHEEAEAFREVLAYIWKTGHSSPQVGHWQTKNGGRRLIAWSNKPVAGEDGTPAYLVTSGIDLTDRARQRAEDERALEGDPQAKLAEVGQLAQEQRSLRRVATLVASEASAERVFTAVSEECARVLEVNASAILRYEGDDTATSSAGTTATGSRPSRSETRLPADETTTIGRVLATGRAGPVDDWGAMTGAFAETMLRIGYRSTVAAPIVVAGILWGAVASAATTRFRPTARPGSAPSASSSRWRSRAPRRATTFAHRARASSRPATSSAAGSNATCTTAPSSASSRPRCMLRVAQARLDLDPGSRGGLLESAARELDARARGAARARARAPSGLAHRARPAPRARGRSRSGCRSRSRSTCRRNGCPSISRRPCTTSCPRR